MTKVKNLHNHIIESIEKTGPSPEFDIHILNDFARREERASDIDGKLFEVGDPAVTTNEKSYVLSPYDDLNEIHRVKYVFLGKAHPVTILDSHFHSKPHDPTKWIEVTFLRNGIKRKGYIIPTYLQVKYNQQDHKNLNDQQRDFYTRKYWTLKHVRKYFGFNINLFHRTIERMVHAQTFNPGDRVYDMHRRDRFGTVYKVTKEGSYEFMLHAIVNYDDGEQTIYSTIAQPYIERLFHIEPGNDKLVPS